MRRMTSTRHRVRVAAELRELMPRFLANRRVELDDLRSAASRADFETARRIGHVLKGAGGGYGLDEITRLGDEMERLARAQDPDVWTIVGQLGDYLDQLEVVYE
jgi:HPt (histidine-containing phosphotransfer) domain-containing protein